MSDALHVTYPVNAHGRLWYVAVCVSVPFLLVARPAIGQTSRVATAPVLVEQVQQRDVVIQQTYVGTVMPTRTSIVGSPVEGQVTEFLVEEGEHVKEGDELVVLRTTKFEIQLAAAEAQLTLWRQQLEDLRISLPIEVKQAQARKLAAEAQQAFATEQYRRGQNLDVGSPVATAELEELKSSAEATLNFLGERAAALELAEETLPIRVAQAETRIRVQEEVIRELRDTIEQHTVRAPFDGYITKEHTEVGQWIAKGGNVVEIVELRSVEIIVQVLETQIGELAVRAGDIPGTSTLDVEVEAFRAEEFQGEIVAIVPQADYQSRTFPVKVRVENRMSSATHTMMLKPGMFARVTLPVRTVRDALLVPKDALVLDRRSPTVWRVQSPQDARTAAGSSAEPVSVQVAADVSVGEWIQVVGPLSTEGALPLQPGDTVITEGNERVNVRTPVTIAGRPSS